MKAKKKHFENNFDVKVNETVPSVNGATTLAINYYCLIVAVTKSEVVDS